MMKVITEQAYIDPDTGLLTEIVRNEETGEIIGKNERLPIDQLSAEENKLAEARASARVKLAALGLTEAEITAMVGI